MGFLNTDKYVEFYLKREKFEERSFEELLKILYEKGSMDSYYKLSVYHILAIKYYFYDPYILKAIHGEIWVDYKEGSKYKPQNREIYLIDKFKDELKKSSKEDLMDVVELYTSQEPSCYNFKDSTYYFTSSYRFERLSNHYACIASIQLLKEKYGLDVIISDLIEMNPNDLIQKRRDTAYEAGKQIALLGLKFLTIKAIKKIDDE